MSYSGGSFFLLIFFVGMFSFLFFRYHYVMILLSVEIMMLSLYFSMVSFTFLGLGGLDYMMFYILMMVCGAGFGICLMIFYVREGGNEMFSY